MNNNVKLLQAIYQNAQMGAGTLEHMMNLTRDSELKKQMENQLKGYLEVSAEAEKLLHEAGHKASGLNAFEKFRVSMMIKAEALRDKSTSHLAEMILLGSNMGVIDALRNLRKYDAGAEKDLKSLMRKALIFEENNAEKLKHFI